MKPSEIAHKLDPVHGLDTSTSLAAASEWLREIAFQLSSGNELARDILSAPVNINIHHHHDSVNFLFALSSIAGQLEAIAQGSTNFQKENFITMALTAPEQALVDRFNTATSAIAQKIKDLIAAGVSDSPEFVSALSGIADGLDALAKPGTPIPGPGPQPTP